MQNCSSSGEYGSLPKVLNKLYTRIHETVDRLTGERKG